MSKFLKKRFNYLKKHIILIVFDVLIFLSIAAALYMGSRFVNRYREVNVGSYAEEDLVSSINEGKYIEFLYRAEITRADAKEGFEELNTYYALADYYKAKSYIKIFEGADEKLADYWKTVRDDAETKIGGPLPAKAGIDELFNR